MWSSPSSPFLNETIWGWLDEMLLLFFLQEWPIQCQWYRLLWSELAHSFVFPWVHSLAFSRDQPKWTYLTWLSWLAPLKSSSDDENHIHDSIRCKDLHGFPLLQLKKVLFYIASTRLAINTIREVIVKWWWVGTSFSLSHHVVLLEVYYPLIFGPLGNFNQY